jgi:hypothetical protein
MNMTRMSKEFSLVLLGAGILTAGSFFWPTDDIEKRADEAAHQQVAGGSGTGSGTRYRYTPLFFIHTGSYGGASSSSARANVSRGGFGGMGRSVSVGA